MALIFNNTNIPSSGQVPFNGVEMKAVNFNGIQVWTSTPDPITIMKTGSSLGSWTGGGVFGSDAGSRSFSMSSQGLKGSTNGNIGCDAGIENSKLCLKGGESTVGYNRALLVSNFTINTKGYSKIAFTYDIDNNKVNRGGSAYAAIGPSGWNDTRTTTANFPNVAKGTGTINLNVSNYQGTYVIKIGWYFQGSHDNDPYQQSRRIYITSIVMS